MEVCEGADPRKQQEGGGELSSESGESQQAAFVRGLLLWAQGSTLVDL